MSQLVFLIDWGGVAFISAPKPFTEAIAKNKNEIPYVFLSVNCEGSAKLNLVGLPALRANILIPPYSTYNTWENAYTSKHRIAKNKPHEKHGFRRAQAFLKVSAEPSNRRSTRANVNIRRNVSFAIMAGSRCSCDKRWVLKQSLGFSWHRKIKEWVRKDVRFDFS